jgi:hypothetical protein
MAKHGRGQGIPRPEDGFPGAPMERARARPGRARPDALGSPAHLARALLLVWQVDAAAGARRAAAADLGAAGAAAAATAVGAAAFVAAGAAVATAAGAVAGAAGERRAAAAGVAGAVGVAAEA